MTAQQELTPVQVRMFTEAMTRLVSGLAVITTQGADGKPCGLLVSSICSYSVQPPSVLFAVNQIGRSYAALVKCGSFGVNILGGGHEKIAQTFAGRNDDKFAGMDWSWDGTVPRLADVPVYLFCTRTGVFHHGDHAILVGEVIDGEVQAGEPLIYYRRRFNWRLHVPDMADYADRASRHGRNAASSLGFSAKF